MEHDRSQRRHRRYSLQAAAASADAGCCEHRLDGTDSGYRRDVAKQRSREGEARVRRINARIGKACLLGFVFNGLARVLQGKSTPLAILCLAIGWCIWIHAMTRGDGGQTRGR